MEWNLLLTRVHLVLIKTLLRPQSTMEYLYLILERKTFLLYYCGMHRCLIILSFGNLVIVFICLLRWQRQYQVVLKSLNGSWIQTWWSARNHAMLIYLVMTSLFFAGSSAECSLSYARFYLAMAQSFRLFCRRLNANFTGDGPRGYVWHDWWMFLRGRIDHVTEWVKRNILSIVVNYATAIYLFVCFIGIHI